MVDFAKLVADKLGKRCTHDFETQSACELKKTGAWKYSLDPTTRATCLAFKTSGDPKVYLLDYETINKPWVDLRPEFRNLWIRFIREGYLFVAHNSFFELCIYENILVKRLGWPMIPRRLRRCTAAKAAACALPRSLDGVGEALKLRLQKDRTGYIAMMQTCKPTRQWNAWKKKVDRMSMTGYKRRIRNELTQPTLLQLLGEEPPKFLTPQSAPDVFATLYRYCKIDVKVEEAVDEVLPDLIPSEREIWLLNQETNSRGLRVDMPTVNKIVDIIAEESGRKLKELDILTMGLVTKAGARNSILEFLALEGIELPDIRARTVDEKLKGFELSEDMHRLLEIRKALSMASTKKYYAFQKRAGEDDRVRDITLFHGASTGRDTGVGIQPHNFPRGIIRVDKNRPYAAVENVVECDADMLRLLYGESLGVLFSALLRNMLIPSEGFELFVADFSKIEVAVLWWLAGNEPGLKILRAGLDPYIYQAAANTGKTYLEIEMALRRKERWAELARQLGKGQILGCGFGMGHVKFRLTAENSFDQILLTESQSKLAVDNYRQANAAVPALWKAYENAAMIAVETDQFVSAGRCLFFVKDNFLWVQLPSRRCLAYRDPQIAWRETEWGPRKTVEFWGVNPKTKKWDLERIWGGTWAENITQAVARDLMMTAIVALEKAKYRALLTVHDEALCEREIGKGSIEEFTEIMCRIPPWADGLPVKAEAWKGPRYKK